MAHTKRSRAAFEADLQQHESPYAVVGTPLPPLDENTRDDGSYVPLWKQEALDERGRKRFHGAFTGGFSAGYFNTVGSKEGWSPSTFVSSRSSRHKDQKKTRAEDFMDEEDLADQAEAQKLQTSGAFSALGSTGDDVARRDALMDMVKTAGETIGSKLLQKMGWKPGQGVGPKVRRKARLDPDDEADGNQQTHLFAPENSRMITFVRKNDHKGLGYEGEARLSGATKLPNDPDRDEDSDNERDAGPLGASRKSNVRKPAKRGGFGVGVLNDDGSGEEDPYEIGPKISYNRTIGGDKKLKKKKDTTKAASGSANPLVSAKPVFISKKAMSKKAEGFRKCHDGRLPLEGFILATQALTLSDGAKYAPPTIPEGWSSSMKVGSGPKPSEGAQSVTDAAKSSTLDAKARAALLGESALPGKSVFDYLNPATRDRLAASTGKANLPEARGEAAPEGFRKTEADRQKQLWSLVPPLEKEIAEGALSRGIGGWMPYSEDEKKRARYRGFLELRAELRDALPERAPGASTDDWVRELQEFAHAARVFRPISGMMASRFTSASKPPASSSGESAPDTPLSKPAPKPADPAEEAAKLGMYGPMTRQILQFYPTRLLCKRFNVKPPENVQPDPNNAPGDAASTAAPNRDLTVVSQSAIQEMMRENALRQPYSAPSDGARAADAQPMAAPVHAPVDVERNEALESEKAGDAVFKAIFGSDDEDE
ncbi:uncharacterized protein BKCO1_400018 [Diplodia corticola]|uniref:G-patch domain-containing protein n=1 Tax=Diplodia corticola TaxID=236234 RepID=A0A1J9RDV4_9PEZI|nr:uncharacterized protein BKCO1_400018 [Diplodia corticola]OJD38720.1 hypothetical protein BKCO1_400018 [Diplodia corticola]